MYFGSKEIESVNDNVITFKDGNTLAIEEKNKNLFTEEPMDASKLQTFWNMVVAKEIAEVIMDNNVRISDVSNIFGLVNQIIEEKHNERLSELIGKDKLDTLARVFGTENDVVASLSVRNIRAKDLLSN